MNNHEISILPSSIYNKISAGEVIERPASIVKELIENALDADADSIKISVYGGGIKKIQVTDNGKGILNEDIKNAFCPHATSKINKEDDLYNIKTLGFRGEALASIAAVSKVTLISKRRDEKAFSINVADGVYSDITECAGNNGTTIITEDLFYNTPARLKFLKKTSSEISEISDIVLRMIISNPNVAFKYSNENKIIYQSPGKGVESAINATYGTENLQKCIKINAIYRQYSIKGYISHPNYPKNNTTEQTIIINGRYIKNTTISSAVKVAYKPYLMTRQYPFYILYLSIPITETDVNVHPNKLDIRFTDSKAVFSAVYAAITNAIKNERQKILEITRKNDNQNRLHSETSPNINDINIQSSIIQDNFVSLNSEKNLMGSPISAINEKYSLFVPEISENKISDVEEFVTQNQEIIDNQIQSIKSNNLSFSKPIQNNFSFEEYYSVGKLFNTYIVLENPQKTDLILIDQHAAHERLLFDSFIESINKDNKTIQPLLLPYIFNVNNDELEVFLRNYDSLKQCGFIINSFGNNTLRIDAVPLQFSDINLESFVSYLISDVDSSSVNDFTSDYIAKKACKAAVKANYDLSKSEINILIQKLSNNILLKCPHGRPIAIKITRNEIEKWFKRIV